MPKITAGSSLADLEQFARGMDKDEHLRADKKSLYLKTKANQGKLGKHNTSWRAGGKRRESFQEAKILVLQVLIDELGDAGEAKKIFDNVMTGDKAISTGGLRANVKAMGKEDLLEILKQAKEYQNQKSSSEPSASSGVQLVSSHSEPSAIQSGVKNSNNATGNAQNMNDLLAGLWGTSSQANDVPDDVGFGQAFRGGYDYRVDSMDIELDMGVGSTPLSDMECAKYFQGTVNEVKDKVLDKLAEVNSKFKPKDDLERQQFREKIEVTVSKSGMINLEIQGLHDIKHMVAIFDPGDRGIDLRTAQLKKDAQGSDVLKAFFGAMLEIVPDDNHFETMHMTANIDVGGYAWVRYGFTPENSGELRDRVDEANVLIQKYIDQVDDGKITPKDKKTVQTLKSLQKQIAKEFKKENPNPRILRQIAALNVPVPEEFHPYYADELVDLGDNKLTLGRACLLGKQWAGEFQLGKNSKDRKLLSNYVQSKSKNPVLALKGKAAYDKQVRKGK